MIDCSCQIMPQCFTYPYFEGLNNTPALHLKCSHMLPCTDLRFPERRFLTSLLESRSTWSQTKSNYKAITSSNMPRDLQSSTPTSEQHRWFIQHWASQQPTQGDKNNNLRQFSFCQKSIFNLFSAINRTQIRALYHQPKHRNMSADETSLQLQVLRMKTRGDL